MKVRLIPLDAKFPSFGPYNCKRFNLIAGRFECLLLDNTFIYIPLPFATNYCISGEEDEPIKKDNS